jgi:hypothetical protein
MIEKITFKQALIKMLDVAGMVFTIDEYKDCIKHFKQFLFDLSILVMRILAVLTFPISFPLLALLYKKVYNDKYEEFEKSKAKFNNR